jgi:hypothetical protein
MKYEICIGREAASLSIHMSFPTIVQLIAHRVRVPHLVFSIQARLSCINATYGDDDNDIEAIAHDPLRHRHAADRPPARIVHRGATLMVEIVAGNAIPKAGEVYAALHMPFATRADQVAAGCAR